MKYRDIIDSSYNFLVQVENINISPPLSSVHFSSRNFFVIIIHDIFHPVPCAIHSHDNGFLILLKKKIINIFKIHLLGSTAASYLTGTVPGDFPNGGEFVENLIQMCFFYLKFNEMYMSRLAICMMKCTCHDLQYAWHDIWKFSTHDMWYTWHDMQYTWNDIHDTTVTCHVMHVSLQ